MLHPSPITAPAPRLPAIVNAAKWPPDDDDAPDAPGGGGGSPGGGDFGGGGGGGDDGEFKKGRVKPWTILVGLLAAGGLAAFLVLGLKQDAEKLTVEQAEAEKKAIFVLPPTEQLPRWREWGGSDRSDELRSESLKQLAWAKDPAGIDLAIAALSYPSDPVQGMAALALAEYGSPAADKARPALVAALKVAGPGAKPQIAWTLVVLGESAAFDDILVLYRAGHLAKVQRLGGGGAFDPDKLVRLVPIDKWASLAGDESPAVRQLVATLLSRLADPKYTDVLVKLVKDVDREVARQAAPGLGKIGDAAARGPLLAALKEAEKEDRKKFLEALRDGMGSEGLVLALEGVDAPEEKTAWFQRKNLMDMIRDHRDPRGGDGLNRFIASKPHIHWETEAAFAMAEVGDIRAVPTLAKRLRMHPSKIYSDQNDMEMALKNDDNERVVAARMLADLAVLHPDKAPEIRIQAEEAAFYWITEMPTPHANGLRAIAAMGGTAHLDQLRKWANPDKPLPKEGQQPPMPQEWVIAQSAMRYVGWMRDQQSWDPLEKALKRRDPVLDVTMDGLLQGGVAILGMSLRAIGVGAAHGFAQWRDPKAFKPLLAYAEEPKENEQSRLHACAALAWVATDQDMVTVAKKIGEYGKEDKADSFRRQCFLETVVTRPVAGAAPTLLEMMKPESTLETKIQLARAIGKAGLDQPTIDKLFEMQANEALVEAATLALILGGDPATAARAVAKLADRPKEIIDQIADHWYKTFGYWSTDDLEKGRIFAWVDNAVAISRIEIRQTPQEWAAAMLTRQLETLDADNGPHSFTRVVLRVRLYQMAQGEDAAKRDGAIRTLKFMGERGVLQALREVKGPAGDLAKAAYHEIMNPKLGVNVKMPDDGKKGSE